MLLFLSQIIFETNVDAQTNRAVFNANGIIASGLANAFAVSSFRLLPFFPGFEVDEKLQKKTKTHSRFLPLGVLPPQPPPNQPTSLDQYDASRDDFFFLDAAKTLWYWDRQTPTLTRIATAAQMGIGSLTLPANAVYYNGGYWFIKEGGDAVTQQTMYEINLTYVNSNPVYSSTKVCVFFWVGGGGGRGR